MALKNTTSNPFGIPPAGRRIANINRVGTLGIHGDTEEGMHMQDKNYVQGDKLYYATYRDAASNWKCTSPTSFAEWSRLRTSPGCHYPPAESKHVDCSARPVWSWEEVEKMGPGTKRQSTVRSKVICEISEETIINFVELANRKTFFLSCYHTTLLQSTSVALGGFVTEWVNNKLSWLTVANWCCDREHRDCGPRARNCVPRCPTVLCRRSPPCPSFVGPPAAMHRPLASLLLKITNQSWRMVSGMHISVRLSAVEFANLLQHSSWPEEVSGAYLLNNISYLSVTV